MSAVDDLRAVLNDAPHSDGCQAVYGPNECNCGTENIVRKCAAVCEEIAELQMGYEGHAACCADEAREAILAALDPEVKGE